MKIDKKRIYIIVGIILAICLVLLIANSVLYGKKAVERAVFNEIEGTHSLTFVKVLDINEFDVGVAAVVDRGFGRYAIWTNEYVIDNNGEILDKVVSIQVDDVDLSDGVAVRLGVVHAYDFERANGYFTVVINKNKNVDYVVFSGREENSDIEKKVDISRGDDSYVSILIMPEFQREDGDGYGYTLDVYDKDGNEFEWGR